VSGSAKNTAIPTEDISAYYAFIDDFARESDRAAVVLGAAKLDQQLYRILQKVLLPNPGSTDELLDGDSPLSTFSARTNLCYRLGLIDRDLSRALHLIRRIRNSFAHEISGVDLSSGAHRDRVTELIAPFAGNKAYESYRRKNREKWRLEEGPSFDFRLVLAIVGARLEGYHHLATKCHQDVPRTLVPEQWKERTPAKSIRKKFRDPDLKTE
jgi:hypothetical protein